MLALEKSWCPDHFLCSNPNCRQGLIDVGFVEENGQLFCENDYEQYFAPKCGKCGNAIIGVSSREDGSWRFEGDNDCPHLVQSMHWTWCDSAIM